MSRSATAVRPRLRTIDPDRAGTQTALIAALNQREIEDLRTSARAASHRDRQAAIAWIQFTTRRGTILIAPLLVDNQLARMTNSQGQPDGAAAAATLGRIEPLVAALETAVGLELHPAGLSSVPDGEALLIRLDAQDRAGALRHRLLIGTPPGIDVEPLPLPAELPARVGGIALRWKAEISLPAIPVARLASIGRGDCILLGTGPLTANVALPGRKNRMTMTIDLKRGIAILDGDPQEEGANVSDRISRIEDAPSDTGASPPNWADLRIASTIEFDGGGLTAAELATLGKGSILPLPASGGTLAVRVIAGGNLVADGELVAVGDGFGVLVTSVRSGQAG